MKTIIIFLGLIFTLEIALAQATENQKRLADIQQEIDAAVQHEDFLRAANLVKERDVRKEIEKAIQNEDFIRAAELRELLVSGSDNSDSELKRRLQEALDVENYHLAQEIQNEIDGIFPEASSLTEWHNGSPQVALEDDYYYPTNETGQPLRLQVPEFYNQVYKREMDGSVSSLEKVNGQFKSSGGGYGGFSGRRTSFVLAGRQSRIVLTKQDLSFVVRADLGVDPSDIIQLVKLDVKGNNRYAHISEGRTFVYAGSSNQVTDNLREISFESLGEGIFQIKVHSSLAPGQYAFKNGDKFFAFTLR